MMAQIIFLDTLELLICGHVTCDFWATNELVEVMCTIQTVLLRTGEYADLMVNSC